MSVVFKTTVNRSSALMADRDAMAVLPIDLEALGDVMGTLAAEQRREHEREASALREKIAKLEGKVDVLMSLMQGKAQIVDLPPLPKSFEASNKTIIRKVRVSR